MKPENALKRRILIGCGGTGGHIYPGIALGQELRKLGCEVLFVGNRDGMEAKLIPAEDFPFRGIKVQKLYRKLSLSNLLFPFLLGSATLCSRRIIRDFKPDGVICTGGFVSGPVSLSAITLKKPLFFHESNSYPGMTTRHLARYTRTTFTSFSGARKHLPKARVRELGIP
ncbi:MAG: UDP-N-acetylglucosamine--N-acetylmuramyl-(pentapeptide) pyrophosphoryl-undecaprenol N-acetylglucosamine transferase, partial [Candidatus Syntrophosphaera sp.]